jgi:hypothetical protein
MSPPSFLSTSSSRSGIESRSLFAKDISTFSHAVMMQLSPSFWGTESDVLAFQVAVLPGEARCARGR